jgi:hypothetical protein
MPTGKMFDIDFIGLYQSETNKRTFDEVRSVILPVLSNRIGVLIHLFSLVWRVGETVGSLCLYVHFLLDSLDRVGNKEFPSLLQQQPFPQLHFFFHPQLLAAHINDILFLQGL